MGYLWADSQKPRHINDISAHRKDVRLFIYLGAVLGQVSTFSYKNILTPALLVSLVS